MENLPRSTLNESVQVVVRCRPISKKETDGGCTTVVNVHPSRGVIEVENLNAKSENERTKLFTYDAVYDADSTQQSVYDETVRPLVASVLEGYNGCVFAYGQTGTGKTYTMEGVVGDTEEQGIIPRAFEQIWAHINRTTGVEFLVYARYLEIYMEEIRDLLKTKSTKTLELREIAGKGVYVSHLHSQTCQSANDMMKAMKVGNRNRTTGVTNMNEHSSRSHAIFQIAIEMAEGTSKAVKVGKLNLIDLAGSERQSKTGATGDRLKEASKINKALSSLGNVIYALAENSPHIPYRDSKLTRLLQDSLGGNSKTIMIANIGPASMNYEETIITLRYSYRAKSIKNQPVKNENCKDAKLCELQREIERLKELIAAKGNGRPISNGVFSDTTTDDTLSSDTDDEAEKSRQRMLETGKMEIDELGKKLRTLEKQMVHGGKNIVDSVNENEVKIESLKSEIAARKKREIEMQQQIDLEDETCAELKQVFANLQQQIEFKRDKSRRLAARVQALRQEVIDTHEDYLRERQEVVETNDETSFQLRKYLMILENFVPPEERSRLIGLIKFDENKDNWYIIKDPSPKMFPTRPVARNYRRPITEYAINKYSEANYRYRGENVLDLKLDMPLRTTQDYNKPTICPQVKAIVKNLIREDTENNRIVIKLSPHGFSTRGVSKTELEGRYNRATRNTVEVNNRVKSVRQIPKSAKPAY